MRARLLVLVVALLLVAGGAGVAVAGQQPRLRAAGPTSVSGTDATAVFTIAHRVVRQVRYADHGTLAYTFTLHNDGGLPLTVTGLAPAVSPRLFRLRDLRTTSGDAHFTVPAGSSRRVVLRMLMRGCETLSARAGSFVTTVALDTVRARVLHRVVTVRLPEELHTGSPREAFCPNATATSRPPG